MSELKEMKKDELVKKLEEIETELKNENAAKSTSGKPTNVGKYREMKNVRARLKMLLGN